MSHTLKNVLYIIATQIVINIPPIVLWYNYCTNTHFGDGDFILCFLFQLIFLWVSSIVLACSIDEYKERGSLIDKTHPKYLQWLQKKQNGLKIKQL